MKKLITYKEWYPVSTMVFCERTVTGILGRPNGLGEVPIIVEGKVVASPHQTDIKGYISGAGWPIDLRRDRNEAE